MRRPLLLAISLLLFCAGAAHPASPRPRPYSGCGLLALRPAPGADRTALVLFEEPGLSRIAELDGSALPRLSGSGVMPLVSVSARRGGWSRIAYDDAGREGWIENGRARDYLTWQEFLPGRSVRIAPGMKKGGYALRSEPGEGASQSGMLTRDQAVRVLQVEGDWVLLRSHSGWFRWRDGDGRLTVSLQDGEALEKR